MNSDTNRPIIVGSGLAGLWTAWRLASEGRPCVLLTKRTLADSASAWAQGGIAAALGPGDSPALHAADTLAAADGCADPAAVRILTTEGPARIRQLVALGARFDRDPAGTLCFGVEGAHSRPRILHAGGDRTGAMLVGCLAHLVATDSLIELREHTEVARLLTTGDCVTGVVAVRPDAPAFRLAGPVVLATGGVGQLYTVTTNPLVATGDGWALAHQVGAELRDLEFLQFHPTVLKLPGVNPAPLVSEAVRGAGAILVDRHGRRFLSDVDPRAELAPRDVVARAVAAADETGGVWLDARSVTDVATRFPGISFVLHRYGLDPAGDLIPVAPALHYAMGGIRTDLEGRTNRWGLWAVGEVGCTGAHGANRLASNSLLEAIVFADRVARALLAGDTTDARPVPPVEETLPQDADARCEDIRREMRRVMTAGVGVVRSEASLVRARRVLAELAGGTPRAAWRTRNQLLVARLIAHAALRRQESRGGHFRTDFPRRDDLH
ncbi:MAG: L-aspartate oxidase, partial [Gemmatimonadales bacterium]